MLGVSTHDALPDNCLGGTPPVIVRTCFAAVAAAPGRSRTRSSKPKSSSRLVSFRLVSGLGCCHEDSPVQAERPPRLHDQGLPLPHPHGAELGRPVRRLRVQRLGGAPRVCVASATPSAAGRAQGDMTTCKQGLAGFFQSHHDHHHGACCGQPLPQRTAAFSVSGYFLGATPPFLATYSTEPLKSPPCT